jgi:hypothetical protein
MVSFTKPAGELLSAEELSAANSSCETCKFVRRGDFYRPETWQCFSPQNVENSIEEFNPVTGKRYPRYSDAAAARSHTNACGPSGAWRVANFVVVDSGAAKYVEQFYKEAPPPREPFKPTGVISSSLAALRAMKNSKINLDDI